MSEFGFQTASPPNGGAIVPGVTPIIGGAVGQILFQGAGNVIQESPNLFWDATNNRLGIGTNSPSFGLDVNGTARVQGNTTIVASGATLNINPTADTQITALYLNNTAGALRTSLYQNLSSGESRLWAGSGQFLTIWSQNAERIRIINGNTLINTTTDAGFKLDVNGIFGLGTSGGRLYSTAGNTLQANFGNTQFTLGSESIDLSANGGGDIRFSTASVSNRLVIKNNGNVLVGTGTDNGYKLDVNGTARVKTDLKIETSIGGLTIEGDASGFPTLKINTLRSGTTRRNWMFATEQINGGDFILFRSATAGGVANTLVYSIFNDGNFGLNTSTNAGYKLDVNGTARVQGQLDLGNASTDGFLYSSPSAAMRFGGGQTTNTFIFTQINSGRFQPAGTTEQAHVLMTVGQAETSGQENRGSVIRHTGTVSTSNGNAIFSNFQTNTVINTTGGTTTYRGFYHNPTLTSMTGVTHYAIHTVNGLVRFENLPTSSAGLPPGTLYNNLGVLMIA